MRHPERCVAPRGHGVRRRVDRDRPPRPGGRDEHPAHREADDLRAGLPDPPHRHRRGQLGRGHGQPGHRLRRGAAQRGQAAGDHPHRRQQRDAGRAGEQHRREHRLHQRARARRALHQHLARDPVAEHPAEEHRDHLGQREGRHHQAQLLRRAAEVDHREGQRDRRHRVAQRAGRRAGHEQPEVAVAQRPEPVGHADHPSLRGPAGSTGSPPPSRVRPDRQDSDRGSKAPSPLARRARRCGR